MARWLVTIGVTGAALAAATGAQARTLPDGRAYEQVTPVDKNGADVGNPNEGVVSTTAVASASGNSVGYATFGSYGDAKVSLVSSYIARRTATGWESTNTSPVPYADLGLLGIAATPYARLYSADMTSTLFESSISVTGIGAPLLPEDTTGQGQLYVRDADGGLTWASKPTATAVTSTDAVFPFAVTDDLRTIVFSSVDNLTPQAAGHTTRAELYAWHDGTLDTVGIDENGVTIPGGATIAGSFTPAAHIALPERLHALSADGARLYFQGNDPHVGGNPIGGGNWTSAVSQLYRREGGTTTLVSRSAVTGLPSTTSAKFLAASRDGSVVYFTSTAQLTADAPSGGAIYRATPGTGPLTFVTADPGALAEPVGISDDGSRLFIARATGLQRIVGTTATTIADGPPVLADSGLQGRVSGDGRTVAFASSTVTTLGAAGVRAVYVYTDADGLRCVSCSPVGGASPTDANFPMASSIGQSYPMLPRLMSDDGHRFAFESDDALVPEDTNGQRDVYLYDDGHVSLISTGKSPTSSYYVDMSTSGDDVFFATRESILPSDTDDGSLDVYDARVGGGFPPPHVDPPCDGDACQAPPATPPAFTPPGSIGFTGPGNQPGPLPQGAPRFSIAPLSKSAVKALAKKGTAKLTVTVSDPGEITLQGRAKIGTVRRNVAAAKVRAKRKGQVSITVRLTKQAQTQLKRKKKLALTLIVTYSEVTGSQRATVNLHR